MFFSFSLDIFFFSVVRFASFFHKHDKTQQTDLNENIICINEWQKCRRKGIYCVTYLIMSINMLIQSFALDSGSLLLLLLNSFVRHILEYSVVESLFQVIKVYKKSALLFCLHIFIFRSVRRNVVFGNGHELG